MYRKGSGKRVTQKQPVAELVDIASSSQEDDITEWLANLAGTRLEMSSIWPQVLRQWIA